MQITLDDALRRQTMPTDQAIRTAMSALGYDRRYDAKLEALAAKLRQKPVPDTPSPPCAVCGSTISVGLVARDGLVWRCGRCL